MGVAGAGAAPGTESDSGMSPGTMGNLGLGVEGDFMGDPATALGLEFSTDTIPDPAPSPGETGPGPDGPDVKKPAVKATTEKTPPAVEEKKEGVKRKARKRSLLNDEEKTVYRRSILGG